MMTTTPPLKAQFKKLRQRREMCATWGSVESPAKTRYW